MKLLAKARRLRAMRLQRESQVQQVTAKRKAEAKLDRERQGSTEAVWKPNEGPQADFYESDCREILYGGAAGGGKSSALTALPLKWAHLPGFLSLTLRRTYKQGKQLRKYSRGLYTAAFPGLKPIKSEGYLWPFPSGAEASYGHCQNEDDHENYDGWEINLLCFDELTHFTKTQYDYICARVRTSDPRLPKLIRATTNPGGPGHQWVFEHWGAWLNPEFQADGLETRRRQNGEKLPPARPGEVLWIRKVDGKETYHREQVEGSLSRTFIPASIDDNPYIDEDYRLGLENLDQVRRKQLRDGNWLIRPAAGLYFKREWVEVIDEAPAGVRWIRNWDLAASEPSEEYPDPDWPAGVKIGKQGGFTIIGDVVRRQYSPGKVESLIVSTAKADGFEVSVGFPQDPGQAGKSQVDQYIEALEGFTVLAETESGDKVTRFGPFSTQAEHGKVKVVRGPWNDAYFAELEAFPTKGVHDDQADGTSGGHRRLTSGAANFLDAMFEFDARHNRL